MRIGTRVSDRQPHQLMQSLDDRSTKVALWALVFLAALSAACSGGESSPAEDAGESSTEPVGDPWIEIGTG